MELDPNNNDNNNNNHNNNNHHSHNGPRGKGRRKVEIKKITDQEDLMISFSKRRSGIFKKASDLSTLTGADVAFLVFSPTGKPISHGSPSVDSVIDRFTGDTPPPYSLNAAATAPLVEAHRRRRVAELSERHNGLYRDLDAQRALQRDLGDLTLYGGDDDDEDGAEDDDDEVFDWWNFPLEGVDEDALRERRDAISETREKIAAVLRERRGEASGSGSARFPPLPPPPPPPPPSAGAAVI